MPQGIGNLIQSLSPVKIYPGSVVTEKSSRPDRCSGSCVKRSGRLSIVPIRHVYALLKALQH